MRISRLASFGLVLAFVPVGAQTPAARAAATVPAGTLLQTSITALRAKDVQAAVFALYAGQLRRRLEMGLYPPDSEDGGSEAVYALQSEVGEVVNPAAFDNPADSLRALDDYDSWTPVVAPGFKPAWASSQPVKNAAEVRVKILATKKDFSFHMRQQMALLQDSEYYRQFHISRECTLASRDKRPSPEVCAAANQAMLHIEKQKGVEGMATMREHDQD